MSQASSNPSTVNSAASTPLEAISEDDTAPVLSLPSPAIGFASSKHLHSVKQAHHKPPKPKAPRSTPSPTPSPTSKKKQLSQEERLEMLKQFTAERGEDAEFKLPPARLPDAESDRSETSDVKRSLFKRLSEKMSHVDSRT